ncbi:hypothetical protein CC78DRAFT_531269 [Lojkania enalia]|uniref:Uncharacterized protein n=1 Tax=Lojkania enalia TaxID=147567 RepID=A0A9P4KDY0_9PLEO|nr:hypothetical protein CC78DRAFT_531269 [Didymosphaeria enalia]
MLSSTQILTEHNYLHAPSPFPKPTATDSTTTWPSMPPFHQYPNNASRQQRKKSTSPLTNENDEGSDGLLFITGNNPDDFKKKGVMTQVRKKAMGSYLENVKPKAQPSRMQSEDSNASQSSMGSDQPEAAMSSREALMLLRRERRSRKASSPVQSPATGSQDQPSVATSSETRVARIPRTIDAVSILESAPIVSPMRIGIKLVYDETTPRPFQSIGKPLDPFQTMYQGYAPRISVEELKLHCSQAFGTRAMGQHWIPTLVKSPHAFLSTLCIASAHYDAIYGRSTESVQTLALRQEVIHLISQNLVNPSTRVDDYNIIALTQLIASEIIAGEEAMLSYHESGIEAMVRQRGGVDRLGVSGRLASTLSWVSLQSAVLREAKPRSIYLNFCASTSSKTYPTTATIPESPLFCPWNKSRKEFETMSRSSRCSQDTLNLLKEVRTMMEFFLHETNNSRQNLGSINNIYKKIMQFPTISDIQKDHIPKTSDWTYEAVRVAAVIQATAICKRMPLSEALKTVAQNQTIPQLYSSSNASKSSESLASPTALRHDSPVTGFSTGPSYVTATDPSPTNPSATQPIYSNFGPPQSKSASKFSIPSKPDFPSFFLAAPASTPSGPNALLADLKTAIENSDLSDAWKNMAGVLLWIGLVIGAASRKSDGALRKWFSALSVRCSILLCFEHPEAIHATLLRMCELVGGVTVPSTEEEIVRRKSSAATTRRESAVANSVGKKRKL